jgi:hypothetical protein
MADPTLDDILPLLMQQKQQDEIRQSSRDFPGAVAGAASLAGRVLAPNLTDLLTKPRPAPAPPIPNAAGKIPPQDGMDPRYVPAMRDIGLLGAGGAAGRIAAPLAEGAVQAAGRFTPSLAAPSDALKAITGGMALEPTSASAASPSTRPSFTAEDTTRLGQLQKDIDNLTKQQKTEMSNVGPKKSDVIRQQYGDQITAKQAEIDRMRSGMAEQQSAYDKATLPIAARNPDALTASRAGALGGSAATGLLHGLSRGKGPWPWLGSAALGGLEGGFGVVAPQLMDLGLPQGTQAHEAAAKNLRFFSHPTEPGAWDYAQNVVAPEVGGGAVLGTIGHGVGHAIKGASGSLAQSLGFGSKPPVPPQVPPSALSTPPPPSALPNPTGKWPSDPSQIKMFQDKSGKWREEGTGHFVPKQLWNQNQIASALKKIQKQTP